MPTFTSKTRRSHICSTCGTSYPRKTDLTRHSNVHLSPEERAKRMIPCSYHGCTYATIQKTNLKTHLLTHSRIKSHVCGLAGCDMAFIDPSTLTRHKQTKHVSYTPKFRNPRRTPLVERTPKPSPRSAPYFLTRRECKGNEPADWTFTWDSLHTPDLLQSLSPPAASVTKLSELPTSRAFDFFKASQEGDGDDDASSLSSLDSIRESHSSPSPFVLLDLLPDATAVVGPPFDNYVHLGLEETYQRWEAQMHSSLWPYQWDELPRFSSASAPNVLEKNITQVEEFIFDTEAFLAECSRPL